MSSLTAIDLSKLEPPALVQALSFETIYAAVRTRMQALCDEAGIPFDATVESEPSAMLLQAAAYVELLLRQRVNDAARGVMVAFATGSDLDQLAAVFGVQRLVITPATVDGLGNPIPAMMEDDTAFRARVVLAPEGYSVAGPEGAYIFHALSAHADVLGASVASPDPGEVVVTILSRTGNGVAAAPLLAAVDAYLSAEERRPLTDFDTIQSATIVNFAITATIRTFSGPDSSTVMDAVQASAEAFAAEVHRLGRDVTLSAVYAALHVPGVSKVTLTSPSADIAIAADEAPWCTAINLTYAGIEE